MRPARAPASSEVVHGEREAAGLTVDDADDTLLLVIAITDRSVLSGFVQGCSCVSSCALARVGLYEAPQA